MATTFVAYVPHGLPSVAELNWAMSSRLPREARQRAPRTSAVTSPSRSRRDGPVATGHLRPQGPGVDAERERLEAAGDADSEKRLTVYKTTDVRFAFSADDANAGWARDTARALALLACGAFENTADGKLLHFGY